MPSSSATATGSAPIVAGWSTTSSTGPCAASRRYSLPELGLVVGQGPIQQALARAAQRDSVVHALTDVQPEEHGDLIVPIDHEHLRPHGPLASS